jgi:hypothetical protein
MDLDPKLLQAFAQATDDFASTVRELKAMRLPPVTERAQVGNATILVQAGGVLVMVLMFAASFVLGVALDTAYSLHANLHQLEQRQDRQDDYLNAIYMMAPQLKPKESPHEPHAP